MKTILYLGLEIPLELQQEHVIHFPLIYIVPRPQNDPAVQQAFMNFNNYTHVVFTSKTAVSIFFDYALSFGIDLEIIQKKCLIAVGKKTAEKLCKRGFERPLIATNETAEGIVEILSHCNLSNANFFWPHSSLSRPVIANWLQHKHIPCYACIFYETFPQVHIPLPNLNQFHEIIFTSPSTVDAFLTLFKKFPKDKILTCIGPITRQYLVKRIVEIVNAG